VVIFLVLTAVSMKMNAFWDVVPHNLVEVYRHFKDTYCLHHQGYCKLLPDNMVQHSRIQSPSWLQTIHYTPELKEADFSSNSIGDKLDPVLRWSRSQLSISKMFTNVLFLSLYSMQKELQQYKNNCFTDFSVKLC
jgi:hypothetical protein